MSASAAFVYIIRFLPVLFYSGAFLYHSIYYFSDTVLMFVCKSSTVAFPLQTSLTGNDDSSRNFNKLEKADILELAVEQLRMLLKQGDDVGM